MSKKKRYKKFLRGQQIEATEKVFLEELKEKPKEIRQEYENPLMNFFDKHYKKLLIIPFVMLLSAFIVIGMQYASTGEFFNKAVDIKGGISLTIPTKQPITVDELESIILSDFKENDLTVRTLSLAGKQTGVIIAIDIDLNDQEKIEKLTELLREQLNLPLEQGQYTITGVGSSLGKSFFREILVAILIAFIFMAIIVFLYFRTPIPSLAVVLAAFSDIIVTLAIINLIGMRISTAGIAAFLMLIGYSVDTNILLSTRVLKIKEKSVLDRIFSAMKTGLTMSLTTIVALTIALVLTQSDVLKQIMIVVLIGLLVDIINTWIQNAGILRWYLDKHGS